MPETPPSDPAYWMVEKGRMDPTWRSVPEVHEDGCYICEDPEFALMGLPLCKPCEACQQAGRGDGHVAADDTVCSQCGYDVREAWEAAQGAPVAPGDPPEPDAPLTVEPLTSISLTSFRHGMKQRLLRDHEQRYHQAEEDEL